MQDRDDAHRLVRISELVDDPVGVVVRSRNFVVGIKDAPRTQLLPARSPLSARTAS
jgi:hypothetical protein